MSHVKRTATVHLRRVNPAHTTDISAWLEAKALCSESQRDGRKPQFSRKELPDLRSAEQAFEKLVHTKLREGYVIIGGDTGQPGALLFRAASPWAGATFDMSLDGARLAAAGLKQGARGFVLRAYDAQAGRVDTLIDAPPGPGSSQTFVHAVLLDASGEHVIYALGGETRRRSIATGDETVLARFQESQDAQFNPFVVQPVFDAARGRLLVFDAGDRVRVLDAEDGAVFEEVVCTRTAETRARALSPSGKRVAVYVASRHIIYNHEDARGDTTNEVRVFDVDSGKLLHTVPAPCKIDGLGFTPDDRALLWTREYHEGPAFVDLETGEERLHFKDDHDPGRSMSSAHFAYSPDGRWLATASGRLRVFDAATREEHAMRGLGTPPVMGVQRVAWSGDATRIAFAARGELFVVRAP